MQTFLVNSIFGYNAKYLDDKRLWKQVLEAKQLYAAIRNKTDFYKNHPTRLMWENYPNHLEMYLFSVVNEWLHRRLGLFELHFGKQVDYSENSPSWLKDERLYSSHRAALLFKNPTHYSQFKWIETPGINYFWPIKKNVD
jgi:hypothetical protein